NAIPFNKSEFYQCYTIVQPRPGVDITITPDPPVAKTPEHFTVSGTLKHDITADKTLLNIDFYDTSKFLSAIPPYNKNFTESFKAGTKFSIDVDNVPTPDKLPLFYAIIVTVGKNLGEDEALMKELLKLRRDIRDSGGFGTKSQKSFERLTQDRQQNLDNPIS
ncbi:hypothetical protein RhiirA5_441896, partial [Rhizophagus irregularis]